MRVNEATQLAKTYVREAMGDVAAADLQGEAAIYDDHLAIWTVTIGFADEVNATRHQRVVVISNADKSLISIKGR